MKPHQKRLNDRVRRMVEDMLVRNIADATIDAYTCHVDRFCRHFPTTRRRGCWQAPRTPGTVQC